MDATGPQMVLTASSDIQEDIPRMIEEDRELFSVADRNNDGFLDKEEFPKFSHPHEFGEMHNIVVNQTMQRRDLNKDGKLSLEEYLKEDADKEMSNEQEVTERERFRYDLDRNNDGFLEGEEVKHWVIPDNE